MSKDGMNYAPEMKPAEVVERGEFVFAASHFDHGHIYGQTLGLHNAGGVCKYIYEPDTAKHGPLASLISDGTRIVDRFEVRRLAVERAGEIMRSLQRWCEADLKE